MNIQANYFRLETISAEPQSKNQCLSIDNSIFLERFGSAEDLLVGDSETSVTNLSSIYGGKFRSGVEAAVI